MSDAAYRSDGPVGIGGWLILPIIGLGITIFWAGMNLLPIVLDWQDLKLIFGSSDENMSNARMLISLSVLSTITMISLSVLCLYHIFTWSPRVPLLMTIFFIASALISWLEYGLYRTSFMALGYTENAMLRAPIRSIIAAAIWIPYFHKSRRVANTFRASTGPIDRGVNEIF